MFWEQIQIKCTKYGCRAMSHLLDSMDMAQRWIEKHTQQAHETYVLEYQIRYIDSIGATTWRTE